MERGWLYLSLLVVHLHRDSWYQQIYQVICVLMSFPAIKVTSVDRCQRSWKICPIMSKFATILVQDICGWTYCSSYNFFSQMNLILRNSSNGLALRLKAEQSAITLLSWDPHSHIITIAPGKTSCQHKPCRPTLTICIDKTEWREIFLDLPFIDSVLDYISWLFIWPIFFHERHSSHPW